MAQEATEGCEISSPNDLSSSSGRFGSDAAVLAASPGPSPRTLHGAGGQPLLRDRVVSWLGCSDAEVDEIQRLLNSGEESAPILPGVMVIDDYFSVYGGDSTSSYARPAASSNGWEQPHAEPSAWESISAGVSHFANVIGGYGLCLSRERNSSPRAMATRQRVAGDSVWEVLNYSCLGRGPTVVLQEPPEREARPATLSEDSVLETMRQERHTVACNGCDQRIVGTRLKCTVCDVFSLCQACTERPLHWPGAPLKDHLLVHPGHHFARVPLPAVHCPRGHEVVPGGLDGAEARGCGSCQGPLRNGVLLPGKGPQYRCTAVECRFALCVSCYWALRQAIQTDHNGVSKQPGQVAQSDEDEGIELSVRQRLRCHVLFSSPLCIGHTLKVCSVAHWPALEPHRELEAWGADFAPGRPSVVARVHRFGRLAEWNQRQRTVENLVRQGDALIRISVGGITRAVNGQAPAAVLHDIFSEFLEKEGEPIGNRELQVDLIFSGLRNLPRLRVEDEIGTLQSTGCDFVARAATTENIRALIAAGDCRILHFSFHTSSDQSLRVFLEDVHGKAHIFTVGEFRDLLLGGHTRGDGQPIRLVFISSCHSFTLGQHLAAAGVPHVVCVRNEDSVLDSSCQAFERHFFVALGRGSSVQQAFHCGVAALASSPNLRFRADSRKFALLPGGPVHEEVLTPEAAPCPRDAPRPDDGDAWGLLPARVEDFVGRDAEVHRLLVTLRDGVHSRRFVLLHGEAGVGKSALMAELGRFVQLRRDLFDEVRWLSTTERNREEILAEYRDGLQRLRAQLAASPRRRVLLLIDDPDLAYWSPLQRLLTFPDVHAVLAVISTAAAMEELSFQALLVGAKPVRFQLGSLEPMSQSWLFASRAPRAILVREVLGRGSATDGNFLDGVWRARQPADYLVLAESDLLRPHMGNPRRIVAAALALGPSPGPPAGGAAGAWEGDVSGGPPHSGREKVSSAWKTMNNSARVQGGEP